MFVNNEVGVGYWERCTFVIQVALYFKLVFACILCMIIRSIAGVRRVDNSASMYRIRGEENCSRFRNEMPYKNYRFTETRTISIDEFAYVIITLYNREASFLHPNYIVQTKRSAFIRSPSAAQQKRGTKYVTIIFPNWPCRDRWALNARLTHGS